MSISLSRIVVVVLRIKITHEITSSCACYILFENVETKVNEHTSKNVLPVIHSANIYCTPLDP